MNSTSYYYYPAVRQGLATAIRNGATEGPRASIDVVLTATAKKRASNAPPEEVSIKQTIQLFGPGDILGFQPPVVSRIDPQLNVGDFEPNYFPAIEFAPCDFAWRFTPDAADETSGKLLPWITLIVLNAEPKENGGTPEFEIGYPDQPNLPRHLLIPPSVLPPLEDAWRWAHVQITGVSGLDDATLQTILEKQPERAVSRLLCTRRLAPRTRYAAFVVPTFKLGVLAGLGCSPGNDVDSTIEGLRPAWGSESGTEGNDCILLGDGRMRLPYYYTWEFRTSERGDFEHLVRLLEPRELSGLGVRDINCVNPGFNTPSIDRELEPDEPEEEARKHYLGMEGALRSLDMKPTIWGQDPVWSPPDANSPTPFQNSLASLINKPDIDAQSIHHFTIEVTDVIKEIHLTLLASGTAVRVRWTTTTDMDSSIEYATDEYYQSHSDYKQPPAIDGGIVSDHELILEELTPGLTYHFRISGTDSLGNSTQTEDGTFQVPPLPTVVPPIYGRWHYGKLKLKHDTSMVIDPDDQKAWIDVLNQDPRHRMAAGKGSEVIRNKQEALMVSAWEQLGAIESTNDLLRRAQFGRDVSTFLYHRLEKMSPEKFLPITAPVQSRMVINKPASDNSEPDGSSNEKKLTVAHILRSQSRIPRASLDPALRKMARANGPIRKRQKKFQAEGRKSDMLARLAADPTVKPPSGSENPHLKPIEPAGQPPIPIGTYGICEITSQLFESLPPAPQITRFEADPVWVPVAGEESELSWESENATHCTAIGPEDWQGERIETSDNKKVTPISPESTYCLQCFGPGGASSVKKIAIKVGIDLPPGGGGGDPGGGVIPDSGVDVTVANLSSDFVSTTPSGESRIALRSSVDEDLGKRFCDDLLAPSQIIKALDDHDPFKDISGVPDPQSTAEAIETTLDEWLNKSVPNKEELPTRNPDFLLALANNVFKQLDPRQTIVERTQNRVRLYGDLAERFDGDKNGDLLRPVLSGPKFPQPMYEPLRDLSHDLLLPGVEKIPQNTIGLLESNRRFIESYMAGLNHEFSCELLWRKYPTDQRGTYFRQFWDVSEYVPREDEKNKLVASWLTRYYGGMEVQVSEVRDRIKNLPIKEKQRLIRRYLTKTLEELETRWLTEENERKIEDLPAEKQRILKMLNAGRVAVIREMVEEDLVDLVLHLLQFQEVKEFLKDIIPMTHWGSNRLEYNKNENRSEEPLVLVIRGDLLKRYPNTVIYAIDGVLKDGISVPGLPEYVSESDIKQKIFPLFHATLPPDLTFLGFPFEKEAAQSEDGNPGMFFILEERVGEVRFGLDTPPGAPLQTWNDLSWDHFGLGTAESIGTYLDEASLTGAPSVDNKGREWNDSDPAKTSAATRAWISCQKPVRISIHADQMIP